MSTSHTQIDYAGFDGDLPSLPVDSPAARAAQYDRAGSSYDPTDTEAIRAAYRRSATSRYEQLADAVERAVRQAERRGGSDSQIAETITTAIVAAMSAASLRPAETTGATAADEWFEQYVRRAYLQGIETAIDRLDAAGYPTPSTVDPEQRLSLTAHRGNLDDLAARQARVTQRISEALADDIGEAVREARQAGVAIEDLGDVVRGRLEKVGEYRAALMGETEIPRAVNDAALAEYEQAGVQEVGMEVEWTTAGDGRVCVECAAKAGTYSVQAAKGKLPAHPLCRCLFLPV